MQIENCLLSTLLNLNKLIASINLSLMTQAQQHNGRYNRVHISRGVLQMYLAVALFVQSCPLGPQSGLSTTWSTPCISNTARLPHTFIGLILLLTLGLIVWLSGCDRPSFHIPHLLYSKSGQNGTWGQVGTPGVLEKPCQAWVYFQVHLISVIGQFSVMHGNQTCNRPRF